MNREDKGRGRLFGEAKRIGEWESGESGEEDKGSGGWGRKDKGERETGCGG